MAQAAGGVTTDPVTLTRTYHGSDGSAFTTREVGNTIVGFSEDLSGQRAFVFNGTRSGFTISGTDYAVPAGANTATGPLVLTYANGGSTLTRTGGDDIGAPFWLAKLPSAFSYPKERAARFQSISGQDLDGVFKGSDGSRAYVRQYGSQVVYVAERFADADATRPTHWTLVIAQRDGAGLLNGLYYDLPKQTAPLRAGRMGGQAYSKPRQFSQRTAMGRQHCGDGVQRRLRGGLRPLRSGNPRPARTLRRRLQLCHRAQRASWCARAPAAIAAR